MIDRFLRVFGDVQPGEGRNALVFFANVFLLLVAYYVIKTVREPLILATGGAELKSYAAAAQAAVLLVYVPAYGWLAGKLAREKMIIAMLVFFLACIQLFVLGGMAGVPFLGFIFYVWVGIFSLTSISQFWSFANDYYTRAEGDRLFPLIAIGSTAGAPVGAALAEQLFGMKLTPWTMLEIASGLLLAHLLLYQMVRGKSGAARTAATPVATTKVNGFSIVFARPYLRLVALLLVLLNIVNTTGEYILGSLVTQHATQLAAADATFDKGAYIGQFYGSYFFWVNVVSVTVQAFIASRLVKLIGFAGALFALPVIAFGAYGLTAFGASILAVRMVKTAENATDYSLMNSAKQMLWLPTTREQKYKGKQTIDTFFVRSGDMLAAGVVFAGTHYITLSPVGFAMTNLIFLAAAIGVSALVVREYRRLSTAAAPTTA
jgi:AAA family ATP:ADP antiporter